MKLKKYSTKAAALTIGMIICAATTFTASGREAAKGSDFNAKAEQKMPVADISSGDTYKDKTVTLNEAAEEVNMEASDITVERKKASEPQEEKRINVEVSAFENNEIAKLAEGYIGAPYQFGGIDLFTGVDSPGFVRAIYELAGIKLPEDVYSLTVSGTEIPLDTLSAGDIIFYGSVDGDESGKPEHAGIYNGSGKVVHASNLKDGVKASDLEYRPILKAVRILE